MPDKDYLDDKIEKTIQVLDKMANALLLDKINVNPQVEKYLSYTEEDLDKLTPSELASGEYILSTYGLVLQRRINRATSIKNWANRCIERIIARTYDSYREMMKFEIRKAAVALNDDYAKRLSDLVSQQETIVDDYTYIGQSINNISNSLGNLARIKSRSKE